MGYDLMTVAYRGYSYSEGTPSEAGLMKDQEAVCDYVKENYGSRNCYNYGISMGGAQACYMNWYSKGFFKALIVENSFSSVPNLYKSLMWVFNPLLPCMTCKDTWPSIDRVR